MTLANAANWRETAEAASKEDCAEVAKLIKSSPSWVRRALRGDNHTQAVRMRIAAAVPLSRATSLGLAWEWEVAEKCLQLKRDLEAVIHCDATALPL